MSQRTELFGFLFWNWLLGVKVPVMSRKSTCILTQISTMKCYSFKPVLLFVCCRTWRLKPRVCRRCPRLPRLTAWPTWATSRTACRSGFSHSQYNAFLQIYSMTLCSAVLHNRWTMSDRVSLLTSSPSLPCRTWSPHFLDRTPTCLLSSSTYLANNPCTNRWGHNIYSNI